MEADKETIFKNAQKFSAKGNFDKAIEEWEKLLKKAPKDGNIFNSIGDIHIKKKSTTEAVQAFLNAANTFEKAGFSLKTIAVYKKILKIDPSRVDVYLMLGDINANRGLVSNAIDDYSKAWKHFLNLGKVREGVDVFRKITQLDPNNISMRIKLAEMCLKEGLKTEALVEYLCIAEFYFQAGQKEDAFRTCEQILEIDSNYSEAKILRGKLLEEEVEDPISFPEKNEIKSEQGDIVSTESMIVPTQKILEDEVLNEVKREALGVPLSMEGAEISPEVETDEGMSTCSKDEMEMSIDSSVVELVSIDNDNSENEISDSMVLDSESDELPSEGSKLEEHLGGALENCEEESLSSPEVILKNPENKDDLNLEPGEIKDSLAEADVYLKYGLSQKAVDQYKSVLQEDPYNINAHTRLIEIYKNGEQYSEAVTEYLKLAKIYEMEGEDEKFDQALQAALLLDPNHPQAKMMARVQGEEVPHATQIVEETKKESKDLDPLSETSFPENEDSFRVESLSTGDGLVEQEPAQDQEVEDDNEVASEDKDLIAKLTPQALSSEEISERFSEGEFYFQQGLKEEAKKIYQLILSVNPDHTKARDRIIEMEVEDNIEREISGLPDSAMFEEIDEEELSLPQGSFPSINDSSRSKVNPERSDTEAKISSDSSLSDYNLGFNVGETETTSEVEIDENQQNEGLVNLSDFLEKELGDEIDLHEITQTGTFISEIDSAFKEFQKGIQEQFGDEDYETHYDLGIAYKEMGLLNEAISEFELSVKGKSRFIDSCNMLSVCCVEKGENKQAIQHLVNALESPLCISKNSVWLKYELGSLYESEGLYEKALSLFNQVKQEEENFKEVISKVENLQKLLRNPNGNNDGQFSDESSDLELGGSSNHQSNSFEKKRRISYL